MKKIVALLIFCLSLSIRLLTLNQIGRTWDENQYVTQGYKMVELLKKGDFSNPYFYQTYEHPPLAKLFYGLGAHFDVDHFDSSGEPVFKYDFTHARVVSAIAGSLSVVVVVVLGWEFISPSVGVLAGITLSTLPWFVGLSQLASLESFTMLFFGLSVYLFLKFINNLKLIYFLTTALSVALALNVKQSNFLLFPIFISIILIRYVTFEKKKKALLFKQFYLFLMLTVTSLILFFTLFPVPWLHFQKTYEINHKLWSVIASQPEVFFGHLRLTREYYYLIYLFITTPIVILVFLLIGTFRMLESKKWILYSVLLWFVIPFFQSFYAWRQHGLRYIIEVYEPLSLISAVGFLSIISYIKVKQYKMLLILIFGGYLFLELFHTKPYYLDYFNSLVGGTKGVYENRSFQIGWWGQGLREAGLHVLKNAPKGSSVGLAVSPIHVVPPLPGLETAQYDKTKKYDYVVVNDFNVLREGFDDSNIKRDYKVDYIVNAAGAHLVTVYKKNGT